MSALSMLGALGNGGVHLASWASGASLPSNLPASAASPQGAATFASDPGRVDAQPNPQPTAPNAVSAPNAVAQASMGAPPKPGVVQRAGGVDELAFPHQAGSYHASEVAGATSSTPHAPEGWSGPFKGMLGGMQDRFAEMRRMIATPLKAPSFPGGEEFAASLNESLRFEEMSIEFELGIALGGHVEKSAQKIMSKITDMKD